MGRTSMTSFDEIARDVALAGVRDWGVLDGRGWIFRTGDPALLLTPDESDLDVDALRIVRTNGWSLLPSDSPEPFVLDDLQTLACEEIWGPFPEVDGIVLRLATDDDGRLVWTTPDGDPVCEVGALSSAYVPRPSR
ncbi:hypothetical protein [Nocardioides zeae]|uniref:Uncharacterized protein n=1 Tax=Nocardioides zeae TaxID=1457234 RepID=A0A6P0HSK5_9ACTN|nr:hypothetical protein [Nocardioides zeae]NEN80195.1 hypothetical protein [Nocardioides zeae]